MHSALPRRSRLRSLASALAVTVVAGVTSTAGAAVLAAPASAISVRTGPATPSGGPVVLDGMDPLCHASMGENTGGYVTTVLGSLIPASKRANDGSIAVLGMGDSETQVCSGSGTDGDQIRGLVSGLTPAPTVAFAAGPADIDAFFSQLAAHTVDPAVLYIPDDWNRDATVDAALTAHATDLADFVNSGGALFTDMNGYGWLTSLLPQAAYNNGGCNGGPYMTAAGTAAFPALTDQIVAACWHGFFTGDVGSLTTLIDGADPRLSGLTDAADGRVSVAIGGASVTLPGALTLSLPAGPYRAGNAATITATIKNGQGQPAAGVMASFSVTAGPDTGTTGTQATDSNGQATFSLTGSAGTDTVTASATVDGKPATSTADVTFQNVPAAPSMTVTPGDASLSVAVTPGTADPNAAPTDILVTVEPGDLTQRVDASGGTASFTTLANGTAYTVSAVTESAVGNSTVATGSGTPHPPATVPGVPGISTVVAGSGQATVTVTPPDGNGGSPVTSYTVTAQPGGRTAVLTGAAGGDVSVTGLTDGTAYTFTVVATNAVGDSAPSAPSDTVTPFSVPGVASLSGVAAGDGQVTVTVTPPDSDGGSPITSFTVIAQPGNHRVVLQGRQGGPVTFTGLDNGTAYTLTVVATNAAGDSQGSAGVTATPVADDPIAVKYAALGGVNSLLRAPVGGEFDVPGGRGEIFQRGVIYWSRTTGAHEVHGRILERYRALRGPLGWLGFPTTDELAVGDRYGRVSFFAGGYGSAVYWTPQSGAQPVHGAILVHYRSLGGPLSVLGYPVADESGTSDGTGRMSRFQRGLVLWSPATGAHEVHGAILARYTTLGLSAGRLGYPTSDEYGVSGGRRSDFAGGVVVYLFATRTTVVTYSG